MPLFTSYKYFSIFLLLLTVLVFGADKAFAAVDTTASLNEVVNADKLRLQNTMNYGDCMEFSVKPCVEICPGSPPFIPPFPVVGIQPEYTEPTAIVETSCLKGKSDLGDSGANFFTKMLSGSSLKSPSDQKCHSGFSTGTGHSSIKYYEAHVYGFAPATRYLSSGNAGDVTKSLTCGIFGAAGMFMNFSNILGGFSNFTLSNLGDQLKNLPSKIAEQVQSTLKDFSTQLSELPKTITSSISNIPNEIQNAINGIQTTIADSLEGVQTTLKSFSNVGEQLANFQQDLLNNGLSKTLTSEFNSLIQPYKEALSSFSDFDVSKLSLTELQKLDMGKLTSSLSDLGKGLSAVPGMPTEIINMASSFEGMSAITQTDWLNSLEKAKAVKSVGGKTAMLKLIEEAGTEDIATLMALHMGKELKVADSAVNDRRYAASSDYATDVDVSTYDEDVDDPYIVSTFATIADVPEVSTTGDTMTTTGRFLNTGESQIAAETLIREFKAEQNQLEYLGQEALRLVKQARKMTTEEEADMCDLRANLVTLRKTIRKNISQLEKDGFELFSKATYLPLGFNQEISVLNKKAFCESEWMKYTGWPYEADRGHAATPLPIMNLLCGSRSSLSSISADEILELSPSCPKTHAGYVLETSTELLQSGMGSRKAYPNCHEECTYVGRGGEVDRGGSSGGSVSCKMVPNSPDLLGSCEGNRLSQYIVDSKNPACLDDRKVLNTAYENNMMTRLNLTRSDIREAIQLLERRIKGLGLSCEITSDGSDTDMEESIAMLQPEPITSDKGVDQYSLSSAESLIQPSYQTASLSGGGKAVLTESEDFSLGVSELGGTIEGYTNKLTSLFRKGGVQQAANNMIGKRMPFGLYPAFISEMTDWGQPPQMDIVGKIKMEIGSVAQATAAPFLCTGPAVAEAYGIVSGDVLSRMNKIANCIGQWGAEHPSTGYAHHKNPNKAAALVAKRAHNEALKFGAIQGNTHGAEKIDMSRVAFTDGGKFKGTGCYTVGTSKRLDGGVLAGLTEDTFDFTLPKKASLTDEVVDAGGEQRAFSMWKNTACCIYFCGTLFGGATPNVKRKY